jgi:hypothetical protein
VSDKIAFDWEKISTTRVASYSDARLLEIVKTIPLLTAPVGGWGIIAEICKRLSTYARAAQPTGDSR